MYFFPPCFAKHIKESWENFLDISAELRRRQQKVTATRMLIFAFRILTINYYVMLFNQSYLIFVK